jgi:uncharacterized membrane protein SpoIIM required for sporulation
MRPLRKKMRSREASDWEQLEAILEQVRVRGVRSLEAEQVGLLGSLYRKAAADLNYYRVRSTDQRLVQYLNALVGRAHNLIYRMGKLRAGDILGFFAREFPRSVRQHSGWILLSAGIFVVFGVLGALEQRANPEFYRLLIPEALVDSLESGEPWYRDLSIFRMQPMASSQIMTHNITVTLVCFVLGITAGLGTVWLLILNGVVLGTVAQLCADYNQSLDFWAFVLPHGVLELPAIFIAGGAALLLGSSLIVGDRHRRRDMLRIKGKKAVRLLAGTTPILVVAGVVEGFFSPMPYDPALKLGFAGLLMALLTVYAVWGGRSTESSR